MFWFPIFNQFAADTSSPAAILAQGIAIENAITRDDVAGTVTIHFQTGRTYLAFLGILSMTWGSIICKQWATDNGDWPGTGLNDGSWVAYYDPAASPFDSPTYKMMGSGPFKFNYLNAAVSWSILRNTAFWGGWSTARLSNLGFPAGPVSRGYVNEIVEYFISDYATRLAGFTSPTPVYDSIAVPRSQIATVWQKAGVKQQYPLATQAVDAMFFAYDVGPTSPYIGPSGTYGYFGENGITPDFFSDVHARRAVAYSFDWPAFIGTGFLGEAQQVGIPLPAAGYEPYYNGSPALKYGINLTRAVEEWKQAWGGQVWANGFLLDLVINVGSVGRVVAPDMLKASLEAQNPLFHVNVVYLAWNAYGQAWHGGPGGRALAPIYFVGWLADYADPDDWTVPFMSPIGGIFSYPQHLDMDPYAAEIENLIAWGAYNETVLGRNANYQRLWQIYHDQAINLPLENAFGRRVTRDWVHGWYYNPISPGVHGYPLWKEELPWEDINEDGKVDIKDLATAAKAFGAYFIQPALPPNPVGPPGTYSGNWDSRADLNIVDQVTDARCDMKVDIKDLAQIAKKYGYLAPPWTPPP